MNISKYSHISEVFKALIDEEGAKASVIADVMNCSPQYVSMIRNGKKIPSVAKLEKLCDKFPINLEQCLQLRASSDPLIDNEKVSTTNDLTRSDSTEEFSSEISPVLEGINGNLKDIFSKISTFSDDIQSELASNINELVDSIQYNFAKKYNHRDLQSVLLKTQKIWKQDSKPPGYQVQKEEEINEYLEGFLELSNFSLYFTLVCTNNYVKLTTRFQERNLVKKYLDIVPGFLISLCETGDLGKMHKNVTLSHTFIVKPSSLVKEIKMVLKENKVPFTKVTFDGYKIDSYFKYE